MEIYKKFSIEAAHRLTNLPPEHKCSRLHGHSFQVELRVSGEVDEEYGWVQDFGEIKSGEEVTALPPQNVTLKKTVKLYHEDNFANAAQLNMVWPVAEQVQ